MNPHNILKIEQYNLMKTNKTSTISSYPKMLSILMLVFGLTFAPQLHANEELSAEQIIKKHADKQDIDSEIEFVTITTKGSSGATTRYSILFCTQKDKNDKHQYLIRVISPEKFKGVGLLARADDNNELEQYFYLPALGQVKRVVASKGDKSPNFLGSNFSYDDLIKENPDLFTYEKLKDVKVEGHLCYHLRASLKNIEEGSEPQYRYRDIFIEKDTFNIQKIAFIGPNDDKPVKTLMAYDYKSTKVDGPTTRPLRAEMRDHASDSVSVITVMRSRFHERIDDNYFTPEGLANWDDKQKDVILGSFKKTQEQ